MRYREDMMNKMPSVAGQQQMPANYGLYGGAMPSAMNYNSMPAVPNSGGYPMQPYMNNGSKTLPAAGSNTLPAATSSKAPAVLPVAESNILPAKNSGMIPAALPSAPSGAMPSAITTTSPAVMPVSGCGGQAYPAAPGQSGTGSAPTTPGWTQLPTTVESPLFTPGFLRTQIGRKMRIEFLIGSNNLTDRTGTLVAVGASYVLIRLIDSDDLMMCDIYSIKFVTIIL